MTWSFNNGSSKRDESSEPVKLDKITARIKATWGLDANYIDYMEVVKKTISGLHDGITTTELDNLAAETAASMTSSHQITLFLLLDCDYEAL